MNPGEFAMRGGIVDLYPMGSIVPYRIDFFDNEIDSISKLPKNYSNPKLWESKK